MCNKATKRRRVLLKPYKIGIALLAVLFFAFLTNVFGIRNELYSVVGNIPMDI